WSVGIAGLADVTRKRPFLGEPIRMAFARVLLVAVDRVDLLLVVELRGHDDRHQVRLECPAMPRCAAELGDQELTERLGSEGSDGYQGQYDDPRDPAADEVDHLVRERSTHRELLAGPWESGLVASAERMPDGARE